jgi:hypothetical protein
MVIVCILESYTPRQGWHLKTRQKKPTQKTPKKRFTKPKKTHLQVVFLGFFERSLCFVKKFAVFPLKGQVIIDCISV